ncbi:SDR family NAD(P)-dependent oxidoreductase, partial [Frankia tisae]|uniref:SDR family NAD(P)-dependent oxidoreductase n=2 Tax=Frankia tisae TaxID=2950104 RepID=UPI0021C00C82
APDPAALDPGAALYWGFGRVLGREHPELRPVLLDVTHGPRGRVADIVTGLSALLSAPDTDIDQVAVRDGRRHVGRLVAATGGPGEPSAGVTPWRRAEQAVRLSPDRPGGWDGLTLRPLVRRPPGPGEVELVVTASALNFLDVMKMMGTYPDPRGAGLLGTECAGIVTAVGDGVTNPVVGDRVVACAMPALASHLTVRADHTRQVPDWLADVDAAGLPMVTATAWYGLNDLAGLAPGETVLIHSAAGGLGLAAVGVARHLGATVIATAGTVEKRRHLADLGIEHVFDSRDLGWAEQTRAVTGGRGVDVVLNSLTGAAIGLGLDLLAEGGRFVEVGKKDIYGGRTISLSAFQKGIGLHSVDLSALMTRHPVRFARLLRDVWDRVEARDLPPLPVITRPFADVAEALREMSHGTHIGKFVVRIDPADLPPAAPEPMPQGRFRADATYLISGGLGALGLSLAEFLADSGARTLVLLGRRAPGAAATARLDSLRGRGVRVETRQVDVADAAALTALLTELRAALPPLRGVVHAAGLLDDATILTLRPEQAERVLAPKVDGARNLDAATDADPLDFFVLFSSAAALIGNAGQAAYAAGNAYLDALAVARRRRGRPGLSVQWGPFAEIGLAAREDNRGARLADRGMGSFTADEAWQALAGYLGAGGPGTAGLGGDAQVVAYLRLDLRQWFDSYPHTAALESWSVLRRASRDGTPVGEQGNEFLARLRTSDGDDRRDLLEGKVRELAGRVLRLDPTAIERDLPFKSLGLDSLMSLEFRNRLESAFGLQLSPTLLWTYGTMRALSGALTERLFEVAAAPATEED